MKGDGRIWQAQLDERTCEPCRAQHGFPRRTQNPVCVNPDGCRCVMVEAATAPAPTVELPRPCPHTLLRSREEGLRCVECGMEWTRHRVTQLGGVTSARAPSADLGLYERTTPSDNVCPCHGACHWDASPCSLSCAVAGPRNPQHKER